MVKSSQKEGCSMLFLHQKKKKDAAVRQQQTKGLHPDFRLP
jgi:hypothetical protein